MSREEFEAMVEKAFERLPEKFKTAFENVGIVVEDYPNEELVRKLRLRSKHDLLGLYQGIPLPSRGVGYGMAPSMPDTISIYQKNIEAQSRTVAEIEQLVYDVLVHETGHYFGMNEAQIRKAGY